MRESDADKRQVPEWVGRLVLLAFCIFLTVLAVNADNPVGTLFTEDWQRSCGYS